MNIDIIIAVALGYPFISGVCILGLMELSNSYGDKMFTAYIEFNNPYPIIRWICYTVIFTLIPLVLIVEVLKVGFTKDVEDKHLEDAKTEERKRVDKQLKKRI